MISPAANGFGLRALENHPQWGWLGRQFEHVPWEGMVFWDLIQPSFMFMVGLAMPYAFANRRKRGENAAQVTRHIFQRFFLLLLLSQVFIAVGSGRLEFQLINVLSQIAFTYVICYGLMHLSFRMQAVSAGLLLAGHWLLFALFPGSEGAFSRADNIGAVIDHFLGLEYSGFYVTINFIPSTVTTLFGAWAGRLMLDPHSHAYRTRVLAAAAAGCFASGYALSLLNPMVKRLWTASFTLASAGCVLAILLFFYWLAEIREQRRLVFPLVVVGMNSIFIYGLHMILWDWFNASAAVFTGGYSFLGAVGPVAQSITAFLPMWYLCYWLYQRKIFLRV